MGRKFAQKCKACINILNTLRVKDQYCGRKLKDGSPKIGKKIKSRMHQWELSSDYLNSRTIHALKVVWCAPTTIILYSRSSMD